MILKAKVYYNASNDSQTIYNFPFLYLKKSFIKVKVDNVDLMYTSDYTVFEQTIIFTAPPPLGSIISIYRQTDTTPLVQWVDASTLRAMDMNKSEAQQLHILEELQDITNEALNTVQGAPEREVILAEGVEVTAGQLLGYTKDGYVLSDNRKLETMESVVLALTDGVRERCYATDYGYYAVEEIQDGAGCFVGMAGNIVFVQPTLSGVYVKRVGFIEGSKIRFRPDSVSVRLK